LNIVNKKLLAKETKEEDIVPVDMRALFKDETEIIPEKLVKKYEIRMAVKKLSHWYGNNHVLSGISLPIFKNKVTAIIGPSGCGKSTFLRDLNRMNDLIKISRVRGKVYLDGINIYSEGIDLIQLRKKIGMVFQKPNPFPMSIRDNITYGPIIHGINKAYLPGLIKSYLVKAALWDEVHDRLSESAFSLSGGQQQRLCIARALSIEPEVILFDEPCSALDPHATAKIEDLITKLKAEYTVVIVTHNMQQAARVSDFTAFFNLGELIEFNSTRDLFRSPIRKITEEYISGRFG